MIVSIIVAMDEAGGIGKDGKLPWHLNTDLQRFKRLTTGHHIIMGRKTFESIGRPLPGRTNLIVTRNARYQIPGCLTAHSLLEALSLAVAQCESEAFVIGGADIFAQALPLAGRIYLTRVHTCAGCDVFFPEFEQKDWTEAKTAFQPAGEKNPYSSTFQVLERSVKSS